MIISHRHKFIFIKTRKTAGTSVEIALSRYCGPRDVLTPTTPEDEQARRELGILPRHYAKWPASLLFGGLVNLHRFSKQPIKWVGKAGMRRFSQHSPADVIQRRVSKAVWNSYFKFTIERDPLERIVSRYYWDKSNGRCQSLDDFFSRQSFDSNYDMYAVNDQIVVDRIIRYDRLDEELREVCAHLGIEFDGWMPRSKSVYPGERKGWRDLLNAEQIERVCWEFAREYRVMASLGAQLPPEAQASLARSRPKPSVPEPSASPRKSSILGLLPSKKRRRERVWFDVTDSDNIPRPDFRGFTPRTHGTVPEAPAADEVYLDTDGVSERDFGQEIDDFKQAHETAPPPPPDVSHLEPDDTAGSSYASSMAEAARLHENDADMEVFGPDDRVPRRVDTIRDVSDMPDLAEPAQSVPDEEIRTEEAASGAPSSADRKSDAPQADDAARIFGMDDDPGAHSAPDLAPVWDPEPEPGEAIILGGPPPEQASAAVADQPVETEPEPAPAPPPMADLESAQPEPETPRRSPGDDFVASDLIAAIRTIQAADVARPHKPETDDFLEKPPYWSAPVNDDPHAAGVTGTVPEPEAPPAVYADPRPQSEPWAHQNADQGASAPSHARPDVSERKPFESGWLFGDGTR